MTQAAWTNPTAGQGAAHRVFERNQLAVPESNLGWDDVDNGILNRDI